MCGGAECIYVSHSDGFKLGSRFPRKEWPREGVAVEVVTSSSQA